MDFSFFVRFFGFRGAPSILKCASFRVLRAAPLSLLGALLGGCVFCLRVLRGLRVRCCGGAAAVRFFFLRAPLAARVRCWRVVFVFWRVSRAGGAWALVRRCVFCSWGALRAWCWRGSCLFSWRASRAGCAWALLRRCVFFSWGALRACCWRGSCLFSWRALRAGCAWALLRRCVFFFVARRGRALLGRAFFFFWRAPLAVWNASSWSGVAPLGAPRAAVWVFSVLRRGARRCASAVRIGVRVH